MAENISKKDKYLINGSGLFFFNTQLDDETKLKIVNWYNNLSETDKKYVNILRDESSDESSYFSQEVD